MKLSFIVWFSHQIVCATVFGSPIIGGMNAERRQFKYQVSIRQTDDPANQHFCGGSIISASWVLTAAHCVDNVRIKKNVRKIQIVAGIILLSEKGDRYSVKSFALHERWDIKRIANDIAVLETSRKIRFSSFVQPIPLANRETPEHTVVTLAGFGFTNDVQETMPFQLQVAHFLTISLSECRRQFYRAKYRGSLVTNGNICVHQFTTKGQCNGDSGGALISNGAQIGIVSFGGECTEGVPGVSTSVTAFLNWIKEKTGI